MKIYDGSNSNLVGEYCGNGLPGTQTSTTNSIYISFQTSSDEATGGYWSSLNQKIFKLDYNPIGK